MPGDGTMIVSPEALANLKESLERYRSRASVAIREVSQELSGRLKRLEEARDDAKREVYRYERELSSCDDDDGTSAQAALDVAEERLRRVDYWVEQVAAALPPMKRANQAAVAILGNRVPRAVSFLTEKIARFAEYANVMISDGGATGGRLGTASLSAAVETGVAGVPLMTQGAPLALLPKGFQWVNLDSISHTDDLRAEEAFHKVSKQEVLSGFSLLKDEVLPSLREDTARDSDYFGNLDRGNNRRYEYGTQRIFDAFFGRDCITLDKGRNDGKYGVTNGRHRILVARELGWTAIPARVL